MDWIDEPYWTIAQARDFLLENEICADEELALDFLRRRVADGQVLLSGCRVEWRGHGKDIYESRRQEVAGVELIDLMFEKLPDGAYVAAPLGASISTIDRISAGTILSLNGWSALKIRRADIVAFRRPSEESNKSENVPSKIEHASKGDVARFVATYSARENRRDELQPKTVS